MKQRLQAIAVAVTMTVAIGIASFVATIVRSSAPASTVSPLVVAPHPLSIEAVEAAVREEGWLDFKVHAVEPVDREGDFVGTHIHGEAVVELWTDDRRFACLYFLESRAGEPPIWGGMINVCYSRSADIAFTDSPPLEELELFHMNCRADRGLNGAGGADQPVTFHFGFSGR